jgi:hypothetical protein
VIDILDGTDVITPLASSLVPVQVYSPAYAAPNARTVATTGDGAAGGGNGEAEAPQADSASNATTTS